MNPWVVLSLTQGLKRCFVVAQQGSWEPHMLIHFCPMNDKPVFTNLYLLPVKLIQSTSHQWNMRSTHKTVAQIKALVHETLAQISDTWYTVHSHLVRYVKTSCNLTRQVFLDFLQVVRCMFSFCFVPVFKFLLKTFTSRLMNFLYRCFRRNIPILEVNTMPTYALTPNGAMASAGMALLV